MREFDYDKITFRDIELNPNLIFICDGDKKKVMVEQNG